MKKSGFMRKFLLSTVLGALALNAVGTQKAAAVGEKLGVSEITNVIGKVTSAPSQKEVSFFEGMVGGFMKATVKAASAATARGAAMSAVLAAGVPTWMTMAALWKGGNVAKQFATGIGAHLMTEGVFKLMDDYAPQMFEKTLGNVPVVNLAVPVISALVTQTMMNAGLSGMKTFANYCKEHPYKALGGAAVAAGVSALAYYYGSPYIMAGLEKLGDGPLAIKKAIIDHGSGSVKGTLCDYNPFTGKVKVSNLGNPTTVTMTEMVSRGGAKALKQENIEKGLEAVKGVVKAAQEAGVAPQHITGVATAWARTGATNIPDYLQQIKDQTGVTVLTATQQDEALFGVRAVQATQDAGQEDTVVFDLGGGSGQFSRVISPKSMWEKWLGEGERTDILGTETASGTFKTHVQQSESMKAFEDIVWSREKLREYTNRAQELTEKQMQANAGSDHAIDVQGDIVGKGVKAIGNVYTGVAQTVNKLLGSTATAEITSADLERAMRLIENKTTQEAADILVREAGVPSAFAKNMVTNLPLVRGIMHAFDVHKISTVNVNSGAGVFFSPEFWQPRAHQQFGLIPGMKDVSRAWSKWMGRVTGG